MIKRRIYLNLWKELSSAKQMIFVSGPRQAGKTTLAKEIAGDFKNNLYFNWDIVANKKRLISNPLFFEELNRKDHSKPLVILDEIHKYKGWKNYLKGVYDQFKESYKFIISGSGRLDLYQKGGDSLAGRYFLFHLFPFTISELAGQRREFRQFLKSPIDGLILAGGSKTRLSWQRLYRVGGFPEPFVNKDAIFWQRWSNNYTRQIIREDIRDTFGLKQVDSIETLFSLLPSRVGSPISINNLAGDLQVSFESVKSWLRLFEIYYLIFMVGPWTRKISRAIVKEKKLYLFNYPEVDDPGGRFENMVALELLRAVYNWNEYGWGRFSLHYLRNKDKEEVDFLIAEGNNPFLLIETKISDDAPAKSLINFQKILNVPAVQLVNKEGVFRYVNGVNNKILVVTANQWLASLP